MPVPAQNSCLREYVARHNGTFVLPPLESNFHHCFHQLFGLVKIVPVGVTILMYSMLMLPNGHKFDEFKRCISARKIKSAFVLENCEGFIDDEIIRSALESYKLKDLSKPIDKVIEWF
jgi:sporadic carbohydrate cluster protein (TIGR04323 family)